MTIDIGEVVAVRGTQVTLRVFEESNIETMFYEGNKYKGVSIREYIGIKRGFNLIVCVIEGEYLDENRFDSSGGYIQYIRKIEVKPIGYFQQSTFYDGIKFMPMIKDVAYLLSESQIARIFSQSSQDGLKIGCLLKEEIPVYLPWDKLFNSHIGIFGNTGSGKSNTLTKLYTTLFEKFADNIKGKSQFILIDFNGEYTRDQLYADANDKKVFKLTTRTEGGDKFPLPGSQIWNTEILALLFQATANTQTPFLNRLVEGRETYGGAPFTLKNYIAATFKMCFVTVAQNKDSIIQLKAIARHVGCDQLEDKLKKIFLYSNNGTSKFACKTAVPGHWEFFETEQDYNSNLQTLVDSIDVTNIDPFDELVVRVNVQLLRDLIYGTVQYDHIGPLLKRVEASVGDLRRVIEIRDDDPEFRLINVISLRSCKQAIKKIVPLLLAKLFYQTHRDEMNNSPNRTMHLIIDEAHNILSQQSNREHEIWKDYRLEMFEEIIKEGRKFGVFLTLSSQRPADISPTIMSQLHNFFIHRLVNDRDLFLIDNTISTLDKMSKSLIPNLSKGSCVVTGTAFDIPIVMQVDELLDGSRPDSDDVDLRELWGQLKTKNE